MSGYFNNLGDFSEDYLVTVRVPEANSSSGLDSFVGQPIFGLIDNESLNFSFGMQTTASAAGDAEGFLRGATGAALDKVPVLGGYAKAKLKDNFKTMLSTMKSYGDSTGTPIPVSFHIFRSTLGNQSTYSQIIKTITSWTQPKVDKGILRSHLYRPEVLRDKLNPDSLSDLDIFKGGLIHFTLGQWFAADGLFCTSSDFKLSTLVDEEGQPVYMTVDLILESYKINTPEEISSWFKS